MIFLNLLNRIFGPKKSFSRQEIDDYKSGTGDPNGIESKVAASDFNDKALEGWRNSPSTVNEGMSTTDKKMDQFVNNDTIKSSPSKGIAFSFILFTATMFTLIIFTYQGNKVVERKPQIPEEINTENKKDNLRREEIDFYTAISGEKQITSNELLKNKDTKTTEENITDIKSMKIEQSNSEEVLIIDKTEEIQLPIQSTGKITNSSKSVLVYKNAKEVYLSELRNMDYRAYRDRPISINNTTNVGLPANQSSKGDIQEFPLVQITEITYIEYLTSSSDYFSNGQFKKALKQYLKILDTYPDDVNANFYGGLCYFNLGKFDKSIDLLQISYTLGYGNFREEANWFSAKAYIESGQRQKAKQLLSEIISEVSFYSEKAKELLTEIKD